MNSLFYHYIVPIALFAITNLLFLIQRIRVASIGTLSLRSFNLSILGFSYFGLTVGVFVGLSSSSVLGAILPALLTMIGGILAYFFFNSNNTNNIDNHILAMIALICISIFLSIGAFGGIAQRKIYENNQKEIDSDKEIMLKKLDHALKKDILEFEHQLKNGKIDTISFESLPDIK